MKSRLSDDELLDQFAQEYKTPSQQHFQNTEIGGARLKGLLLHKGEMIMKKEGL